MEAIAQRLLEFIHQEFPAAKNIGIDDPLLQGTIDSLGIFTLVAFIKNTYDVSLGNNELSSASFASVRALSEMIERKRAAS